MSYQYRSRLIHMSLRDGVYVHPFSHRPITSAFGRPFGIGSIASEHVVGTVAVDIKRPPFLLPHKRKIPLFSVNRCAPRKVAVLVRSALIITTCCTIKYSCLFSLHYRSQPLILGLLHHPKSMADQIHAMKYVAGLLDSLQNFSICTTADRLGGNKPTRFVVLVQQFRSRTLKPVANQDR